MLLEHRSFTRGQEDGIFRIGPLEESDENKRHISPGLGEGKYRTHRSLRKYVPGGKREHRHCERREIPFEADISPSQREIDPGKVGSEG